MAVPRPAVILHLLAEHLTSNMGFSWNNAMWQASSGSQLLTSWFLNLASDEVDALTGCATAHCVPFVGASCGCCADGLPAPAATTS